MGRCMGAWGGDAWVVVMWSDVVRVDYLLLAELELNDKQSLFRDELSLGTDSHSAPKTVIFRQNSYLDLLYLYGV